MLDRSAVGQLLSLYSRTKWHAAIAGRRYTTYLTTDSVLPVLLNILLAIGRRNFAVYGPETWNSLAAELRLSTLFTATFARRLKAHLFVSTEWHAPAARLILLKAAMLINIIIIILIIIIIGIGPTYIDQNLQLHIINTFQFTDSCHTTKQHHCKHDVTWPAAHVDRH